MAEIIAKANEPAPPERARFRQIAHALQDAIQNGEYHPGDHLPTEMALARAHGVSRVTAAAALNELARVGLVSRAPRRGTVVLRSRLARSSSRPLVAWLAERVETTFGLTILRGIQRGASNAGFGLLLGHSGSSPEEEGQAIRDAVDAGATGIIIFIRDGESYNAEVLRLVLGGYPVVLVDRYLRGVRCAMVSSDNVGGSRLLVQRLLDAGHSRICVLTYPPNNTSTIEDRVHGYVQALTSAGVSIDYSLHYVPSNLEFRDLDWEPRQSAIEAFVEFLRARPDVTAIYATNAFLALIAFRATQRLGMRIPDDISMVCIDPLEAIPLSLPRVTTAVQMGDDIGEMAVTLLRELMARKPPRTVMFPMEIQDAGSVGPPVKRR